MSAREPLQSSWPLNSTDGFGVYDITRHRCPPARRRHVYSARPNRTRAFLLRMLCFRTRLEFTTRGYPPKPTGNDRGTEKIHKASGDGSFSERLRTYARFIYIYTRFMYTFAKRPAVFKSPRLPPSRHVRAHRIHLVRRIRVFWREEHVRHSIHLCVCVCVCVGAAESPEFSAPLIAGSSRSNREPNGRCAHGSEPTCPIKVKNAIARPAADVFLETLNRRLCIPTYSV